MAHGHEGMRYFRTPDDGTGGSLVAAEGETYYDLTAACPDLQTFRDLLRAAAAAGTDADDIASRWIEVSAERDSPPTDLAVPAAAPEIWGSGVTYAISEQAREEESGMPDIYLDAYEAERPEVFFKATPSRTVSPGSPVGIRGDADWNVPEPELAIVVYRGEIVGFTVGNDMSSRDIEGENPLYLPQAKTYDRCCSIGPCVASTNTVDDPLDLAMTMEIERDGEVVFEGSAHTSEIVRTTEELVGYMTRHNPVPDLTVLLTGTSIVPPDDFTLARDDHVSIEIESIGTLENPVIPV